MNRKRIAIISVIVVIIMGLTITTIINRNPRRVFARIFSFELPETAKFIEYHYQSSGDYLGAKIKIDRNDIENLSRNLLSFFGEEIPDEEEYFVRNYSWWDLEKCDIVSGYMRIVAGKKTFGIGPKSSSIWVYLASSDSVESYLYIDKN